MAKKKKREPKGAKKRPKIIYKKPKKSRKINLVNTPIPVKPIRFRKPQRHIYT